jgi:Zc3h12a-like Ribonuclease NYN domain
MPRHVVVDGSNIATEGRTMPSLRQLNDAVMAFMEEFPEDLITVVVDATFGHRIDSNEVPEFDAAVENNEVVSPPAGAVGRGDAFVLAIANKVHATILSNDSYQEFHGDHDWLFDEGRLLGGKPVPNVGWVFVARTPVRGPLSRRAVRDAKKGPARGRSPRPSKLASEPLPVPKTPPPKAATPSSKAAASPSKAAASRSHSPARVKDAERAAAVTPPKASGTPAHANPKNAPVNELLVFIDFVEKHPVGSIVTATIESFSSHGAYAMAGPARCYVPLRFMGSPPPRSARDAVKLGDERSLVVVSFNAARRGIDAALEGFEPPDVVRVPAATKTRKRTKKAAAPEPTPVPEAAVKKRTAKKAKAVAEPSPAPVEPPPPDREVVPAKPTKATRKKVAATPSAPPSPPEPVPEPPAKAKRTVRPRKEGPAKTLEPATAPVKAAKKARTKKAVAPG